jgi:hypothetical protein
VPESEFETEVHREVEHPSISRAREARLEDGVNTS